MIQNVHPFPARMAPELALKSLATLKPGQIVIDPMTGSGTVLQQARLLGLSSIGFDLDPLAVLVSKVATTPLCDEAVQLAYERLVSRAQSTPLHCIKLPWMDGDQRTQEFVGYWFDHKQRKDLRRLAFVLSEAAQFGIEESIANALRVALSRIIVTKASAASLAQDTSHSRPHRVRTTNDYDVFAGYAQSVRALRRRIAKIPTLGQVAVSRGDARKLTQVADESADMVLTSPPYLNAIDYMRGHKMSLVWLGYPIGELTKTRSVSIGSERKADLTQVAPSIGVILKAMGDVPSLPDRHRGMIKRYAIDLSQMLIEVNRVLKGGTAAVFVMGNSCLKDVFIQNSEGLIAAAEQVGLKTTQRWERDLPSGSRYLPTPASGSLSKRMRKEVIVSVLKP